MLRSCTQHHVNTSLKTHNIKCRTFSLKSVFSFFRLCPRYQDMNKDHRLVWIDMEMTGLDPLKDKIMEVACIITEANLDIVAEHQPLIIHQPEDALLSMNDWCVKHHGKSGLTRASQDSTLSLQQAESRLLSFLKMHTPAGKCPIAGNSVYMDRQFLTRYMPHVDKYLHYRIIDVSSVKELCRRWSPLVYQQAPKKNFEHRALADLRESIKELLYYRKFMFSD